MSEEVPGADFPGPRYKYAGFWVRSGAAVIDTIIIMVITFPVLTAIYGVGYWQSEQFVAGAWDIAINWLLPALLVLGLWHWKQATPGKMIVKARIVDARTGEPASFKRLIIRYLGYYVSIIPLFVGVLWIAWDARKQGWHDKLAGTVVVRENEDWVEKVILDQA